MAWRCRWLRPTAHHAWLRPMPGTPLPRGLKVIIAVAGMAAHLAGVLAAETTLPVIGVPMPSSTLQGLDSLLSTVQMPAGVPVATMALGTAGAYNAALFAAQILALGRPRLTGETQAAQA